MAVEMFDYLDDIIALETASKCPMASHIILIDFILIFMYHISLTVCLSCFSVFSSITTFHVNSMTSAGQCRLSPLIPLIQDSSQLYDFLVRIMFKLHSNLPNDVLSGKCLNLDETLHRANILKSDLFFSFISFRTKKFVRLF